MMRKLLCFTAFVLHTSAYADCSPASIDLKNLVNAAAEINEANKALTNSVSTSRQDERTVLEIHEAGIQTFQVVNWIFDLVRLHNVMRDPVDRKQVREQFAGRIGSFKASLDEEIRYVNELTGRLQAPRIAAQATVLSDRIAAARQMLYVCH